MSDYTPLTWCSSRQVLGTVIGLLVLGTVTCYLGYNNVIPIVLNSGTRPWALGIPDVVAIGIVLIATLNTLPTAPEWEQPLHRRTQVAHACMWSVVIALGVTGPAVAAARLPSNQTELHPSSGIAFYLTVAGICGATIHLLGRSIGTLAFLTMTAATIAIEQATNHYPLLADVRASPSWITSAVTLCIAIIAAYRTAGHPPSL